MKVSICVNTACESYNLVAYPELHIFEYLLASLRRQTFKDFELVIADVLYETRKDYFKDHKEAFRITHVPVKPNIWTPMGLIGICATKNTCLMYASGEIICFTDDCSALSETYIEEVVKRIKPKYCIANTYNIYRGDEVIFKDVRKPGLHAAAYGNVSLFLSDYLELNGYEELYDGSKGLEDCDLTYRIRTMKGIIELIDVPAIFQTHKPYQLLGSRRAVRCPRIMEAALRARDKVGRFRANEKPMSTEEFEKLFECSTIVKGYKCPYVGVECKSWMSPEGTGMSSIDSRLMNLYKHPSLNFDLTQQRQFIEETLLKLSVECSLENVNKFLDDMENIK